MKKTLIALAVLGAAAGVAHAQSNVTIYGIVDTGFIKETGKDVKMGENVNNRIGFRGVEDLGSGQKATFELERRFELADGTQKGVDWDGAANVGLKGDNWGAVRLGRINEITTEYVRKLDPFNQYGVGGMVESTQRSARISDTVRYDSPNWSGFHLAASFSLGRDKDDSTTDIRYDGIDNEGYGIGLMYDNGPLMLLGNWSRIADSNDSYSWNLGGAYKFGPARISLAYEQTRDKGAWHGLDENWINGNDLLGVESKQRNWLLGLQWALGPGRLNASFNYAKVDDVAVASFAGGGEYIGWNGGSKDLKKYAIGYTYDLSKRTSIYGVVAYNDFEDEQIANFYGYDDDSVTGVQIGITHKF